MHEHILCSTRCFVEMCVFVVHTDYVLFSSGLPRTAPPIRDSTHFTHRRDWQGFAIDDRRCCIVSRSRPLTACQGPKQPLLHLHGYSIQVHDVPATSCLSAPSAMQTCLAGRSVSLPGAFRHLSDLTPRATRGSDLGIASTVGTRSIHVECTHNSTGCKCIVQYRQRRVLSGLSACPSRHDRPILSHNSQLAQTPPTHRTGHTHTLTLSHTHSHTHTHAHRMRPPTAGYIPYLCSAGATAY